MNIKSRNSERSKSTFLIPHTWYMSTEWSNKAKAQVSIATVIVHVKINSKFACRSHSNIPTRREQQVVLSLSRTVQVQTNQTLLLWSFLVMLQIVRRVSLFSRTSIQIVSNINFSKIMFIFIEFIPNDYVCSIADPR